jgi:hypothetical protein
MAAAWVQGGQGQHLLSAAGQYVPFDARIEASGQAAEAEAAEGAAQEPAAAQEIDEGEQTGSKSSSKSSRRSKGSERRSSLRHELGMGGVPPSAAAVLAVARLSLTLEVLKGFLVKWAVPVACLAEKGVTLRSPWARGSGSSWQRSRRRAPTATCR